MRVLLQGQGEMFGHGEQGEGLPPWAAGPPGPAELVVWAQNLPSEFLASLLNALSAKGRLWLPPDPTEMFYGSNLPRRGPPVRRRLLAVLCTQGQLVPVSPDCSGTGVHWEGAEQRINCPSHSQLFSP